MQIIPALYIKDGKAASYVPGDYLNMQFLAQDPYEIIDMLGRYDVQRIHLVDIDASLDSEVRNTGLIGSLANVSIPNLEVAGGIADMDHIKSLQYAGVDYWVLGTAVFEDMDLLREIAHADHIPNDRVMISFDIIDGVIASHGWTRIVALQDITELIGQIQEIGFQRVIVTRIDTQNPGSGPDLAFYEQLVAHFPQITFTASGHIRSFEDIDALRAVGVHEVIVGNEIYQDETLLARISAYNEAEGA
ncbi:MAG: 1-(5-phosphoribosyl)-5-[(5-phosphoribosylamino) methylideneamino]imidazole-4-carboxamide isomerase [Bacteroidia bacterium]